MDVDAEVMVIGTMLNAEGGGALGKTHAGALLVQSGLQAQDFITQRARRCWEIIERLVERGRAVNCETVNAYGIAASQMTLNDLSWLQQWWDSAVSVSREAFGELCGRVATLSHRRRLTTLLEEQMQALKSGEASPTDVAAAMQQHLTLLSRSAAKDSTSRGDLDLAEVATRWEALEQGTEPPRMIPTGSAALDGFVGGFPPNYTVILGRPGQGKTAFVTSVITDRAAAGGKPGLIGLEDGVLPLQRRNLAVLMGWPLRDIGRRPRDFAAQERFANATEKLAPIMARVQTAKPPTSEPMSVRDVLRVAEKWRINGLIDSLIVDHTGQLGREEDDEEDHRLRVAEDHKAMRDWSVANEIPVIGIVPTKKPSDQQRFATQNDSGPPSMYDGRDSSEIEGAARLILGVWRHPADRDHVRVTVLKATEGEADKSVLFPSLAGGIMVDLQTGAEVDLAAERKKRYDDEQAKKKAARAEALAQAAAEKLKAEEEAKSREPQGGLNFAGDAPKRGRKKRDPLPPEAD